MNPKGIKSDWKARGFSFGVFEDPPGQVWSDFIHDVDELFMLVEGDVTLTLAGKVIKTKVGEEILIPAGVMHTVATSNNAPSVWYYGYKNKDTE